MSKSKLTHLHRAVIRGACLWQASGDALSCANEARARASWAPNPSVAGDAEASDAAGDAATAREEAEVDRLVAAARAALGDYSQAQQAHDIRDIAASWNIRRLAERYLASIAYEAGCSPSASVHCFGEGWRNKPSLVLEGRC